MNPEIEARLKGFGIRTVAESPAVSIFMREGCVAMAGRTSGGGLSLGSTGLMTDHGLCYLTWSEGHARLAGKGGDAAADAGQVEAIRKFSEDLKTALQLENALNQE